jgi:hypothetical protein
MFRKTFAVAAGSVDTIRFEIRSNSHGLLPQYRQFVCGKPVDLGKQ